MIPTNIPPQMNQPAQVEKVEDIRIQGLISQLKYSLNTYRTANIEYGKNNMINRALFLDILTTKNRQQLFQFNFFKYFIPASNTFCARAVEELQIYIEGYSIDDVISAFDISNYSNTLDKLYGDLKMKSVGGENVPLTESIWESIYGLFPESIHCLIAALRLQNFPEPEFTDFTRVPKDIPIRLASGEPNPDFFIQWFDNCKKFVCRE